MPKKYLWKGYEVELVPGQMFDTHWNVYWNQPTEDGGSRRILITVRPGIDLTEVDADSVITPVAAVEKEPERKLAVNSATYSLIKEMFPGIGRTAARAIVKNRPASGYADFEELVALNRETGINWEELRTVVVF